MARRVWLALIGCMFVGSVAFWWYKVEPIRRHFEFCREVKSELGTLAKKRPAGITREQWQQIVAWTLNAHANTLVATSRIPPDERERFVAELRRRLQGPVDLGTIDWIWDEFVRLAPGWGPSYSEQWRPTSPASRKNTDRSPHPNDLRFPSAEGEWPLSTTCFEPAQRITTPLKSLLSSRKPSPLISPVRSFERIP
jgi:hypothetical protein